MNPLSPFVLKNSRFVRHVARFLTLLLLGFLLSLILFNDDVLEYPTWPFILYGLVFLSLLVAWRWERKGGLLTMVGGLILGTYLLVNAVLQYDMNVLLALLGVTLLTLPCFSVGWLFYTLGQHPHRAELPGSE